jgi:ParB family chromosome partitioning protein
MHQEVPLTEIVDNPFQPRSTFNEESIASLAAEIKAEGFWNGTLQGRRNARGKVELVFGHRRLRALRLLERPSVRIELLDLADADMALRALEENLQRQDLTDFEQADAVARVIELESKRRTDKGKSDHGVITMVADRLGMSHQFVSRLKDTSATIVADERAFINGAISANTALLAKQWGKRRYLQTIVRQARAAKKSKGKSAKPTPHTIARMKQAVAAAPENLQRVLEKKVFSGRLTTPEAVENATRSLKAARVKRRVTAPPDLNVVIFGWTEDLEDWNKKLATVLPYMDYIEGVPENAEKFRAALKKFIETATKILNAAG